MKNFASMTFTLTRQWFTCPAQMCRKKFVPSNPHIHQPRNRKFKTKMITVDSARVYWKTMSRTCDAIQVQSGTPIPPMKNEMTSAEDCSKKKRLRNRPMTSIITKALPQSRMQIFARSR